MGPLIEALNDDDGEVRYEAMVALSWIADGRAQDTFICFLCDDYWAVRKWAAMGLERVGDEKAVGPLV
jgi:HEAT repeat protein